MKTIANSELILNSNGSIYHLSLFPEQIANDIIVVGDPERVEIISAYFDTIEYKVSHREFVTHTGTYNNKRISVVATGIGCDNIDIVLNELDALVNIDLKTRTPKANHTSLNIIRIGTCGALQEDISVDSFVVSEYSLGLDGLLNYYATKTSVDEQNLIDAFYKQTNYHNDFAKPYCFSAGKELFALLSKGNPSGITATASGFYGPQGRVLRLPLKQPNLNSKLTDFSFNNNRIVNYEMESAAIYGLSNLLGHNACTICAVIANRFKQEFSANYKLTVKQLIEQVLQRLTSVG